MWECKRTWDLQGWGNVQAEGLAVLGTQVWLSGSDGKIRIHSAEDGSWLRELGEEVDSAERLSMVYGALHFSQERYGPRHFSEHVSLRVCESRREVYVCDHEFHRIQVFSNRCALLRTWGGYGRRHGELAGPVDLCVTHSNIYVLDAGNSRVETFTFEGNFTSTFCKGSYDTMAVIDEEIILLESHVDVYNLVYVLGLDGSLLRSARILAEPECIWTMDIGSLGEFLISTSRGLHTLKPDLSEKADMLAALSWYAMCVTQRGTVFVLPLEEGHCMLVWREPEKKFTT